MLETVQPQSTLTHHTLREMEGNTLGALQLGRGTHVLTGARESKNSKILEGRQMILYRQERVENRSKLSRGT